MGYSLVNTAVSKSIKDSVGFPANPVGYVVLISFSADFMGPLSNMSIGSNYPLYNLTVNKGVYKNINILLDGSKPGVLAENKFSSNLRDSDISLNTGRIVPLTLGSGFTININYTAGEAVFIPSLNISAVPFISNYSIKDYFLQSKAIAGASAPTTPAPSGKLVYIITPIVITVVIILIVFLFFKFKKK
jgi:hypothetical protein